MPVQHSLRPDQEKVASPVAVEAADEEARRACLGCVGGAGESPRRLASWAGMTLRMWTAPRDLPTGCGPTAKRLKNLGEGGAVRSDGRGCGLWLATTAYFHMATRISPVARAWTTHDRSLSATHLGSSRRC